MLNARLVRALGLSSYPAGSVVHEIASAVEAARGKRNAGTRRTGLDRGSKPVLKIEKRGMELEVLNNLWPVCVDPGDLEWVLGELHAEVQAGREIIRATSWPA